MSASLALGDLCEDNAKAEMGERGKAGGDGDVAVLVFKAGQVSSAALRIRCWPILFIRYHHQGSPLPPLP